MTAPNPTWPPPAPVPIADRCRWPKGCEERATDWHIRYDGTLANGVGRELRLCAKHEAEQKAETARYCLMRFQAQNSRMRFWTLDTFPADDAAGMAAKKAAIEWKEDLAGDYNLIIHGPVGSGKSGLAWGITREIAVESHWDPPKFVNVRQLLTSVRRSFNTGEAEDPMDELIEVWTLVLDDLGAERITDWTREWLATLIEGRYAGDRSTIVTSNYSPAQLARRLGHDDPVVGKRIVSRLVEDATIIKLDRADLRLRKAA